MSDMLFWLIAIVMIALGAWTNYMNWSMYFKAKKAKETFLQNHKDSEISYVSKNRWIWFVLLAIVCIAFCIILSTQDTASLSGASRWSQVGVYAGLAIFSIALIPESIMDAKIVHCPDGFMYENEYIRYRNINKIEIGNGFFKATTMYMAGAKETAIPKNIAKWVLPKWEEYKAERSARRKRKGKRGQQAD